MIRVGHGFDVHPLVSGRPCIIGGVRIPHDKGLDGHSDADVLLHAVCDALLGAVALGDIGRHFPPTDARYRDVDSRLLLRQVAKMICAKRYNIINIDATIMAESPRLAPHVEQMCQNIAEDCEILRDFVNVKATTTEKLGFVGRGEGIAVDAVCLVQCYQI